MTYYDKHVNEDHQEIKQYQKNLLKDPNSPKHKSWKIITMKVMKIGEAQIPKDYLRNPEITIYEHENSQNGSMKTHLHV